MAGTEQPEQNNVSLWQTVNDGTEETLGIAFVCAARPLTFTP